MGMSKVEEKILEEIKTYQDRYFAFDEPVPFCGLKLYPIKVRNYTEFLTSNACFLLNKNDDPKGISMSHLDYLISKMNEGEQGRIWSFKFSKLIELIFRIENGLKCPKCGKIISYEEFFVKNEEALKKGDIKNILTCECGGTLEERVRIKKEENSNKNLLLIDENVINAKDFQRLRRIVMYQNLPDFKDDSWVHKAVRDDQAAKNEMLSKGRGTASLEKKMICVCAQSNYKLEEVYDMPIRKFLMLLSTIDDVITYSTNRIGMMTGMVSFKNKKIDHWIYKQEEGLYESSVDADSFKNSISQANG